MYIHHDADGYATWTQILNGFKFWVVMRPKGYKGCKSRKEIFEMYADYLKNKPGVKGFYGEKSERFVIYGAPEDIM
jgi:hypothetical protein